MTLSFIALRTERMSIFIHLSILCKIDNTGMGITNILSMFDHMSKLKISLFPLRTKKLEIEKLFQYVHCSIIRKCDA